MFLQKFRTFSVNSLTVVLILAAMWFNSVALAAPVNGLGVSYDVYDFGTYSADRPWYQGSYSDPNNNNWYVPAHNFKNPVYLYQLNPTLVQQQMQNMRSSGIDVLVLHMSPTSLSGCEASGACYTPYNDGIWGFTTDVDGYALRPQQSQNLTNILTYATQIGFRKVFLRFNGSASGTNTWDETAYQKTWNFIYNTHNVATSVLNNTATRLQVDLGGEQMGLFCDGGTQCPGLQAYVQRLWSDYTYTFGTSDTVGFSFIACSYIVQNGLSWYGSIKPNEYAFSNYGCDADNAGTALVASWNALGSEKTKPIMIIETHWNSANNASSWASAFAANPGMVVTDIVQWMTDDLPTCQGCDANLKNAPLAALASTTQAYNYLPLAGSAGVDNLNVSLLNIDASSCTSTSDSTCAKFNVGYAPSGGNNNWQIWVVQNNGSRTLWGCNAGSWTGSSALTAGWMVKGSSYRFDYFKVSSCSANPAQGTQSATSYISFR